MKFTTSIYESFETPFGVKTKLKHSSQNVIYSFYRTKRFTKRKKFEILIFIEVKTLNQHDF